MTEPAVALTDYLLAGECGLFALLIGKGASANPRFRDGWVVFFAALGAASLLGGTVHGFFQGAASAPGALLWKGTMLVMGLATMACWRLGAGMLSEGAIPGWIRPALVVQFLTYAAVVLWISQSFWVAILNYLPAILSLLFASWRFHRKHRIPGLPLISLGLAATLVASAIQQLRIGVHPRFFDHNTLYHVMVGAALVVLFLGVRRQPSGTFVRDETC